MKKLILPLTAIALSSCSYLKAAPDESQPKDPPKKDIEHIELYGKYEDCVRAAAKRYSTAKGTVYEIADSAHAACNSEFKDYEQQRVNFFAAKYPIVEAVDIGQKDAGRVKAHVRESAIQIAMESRLKK